MKKHKLNFSTFLKLLELEPHLGRSELKGFQGENGYNYWRPIRALCKSVLSKEIDLNLIPTKVAALTKGAKEHQFKYNSLALTRLAKWCESRNVVWQTPPARVNVPIGEGGLSVNIEPEAAYLLNGRYFLMHAWATNTPILSNKVMSAAFCFLRQFGNWPRVQSFTWSIFDSVKNKMFEEASFGYATDVWLTESIERIDKIWKEETDKPPLPKRPPTLPPPPPTS